MSQTEQINLLEEIRDLLKEIRDNAKPSPVVIGPFLGSPQKHFDAPENCTCRWNESGQQIGGWNCPVHKVQV